MLKNLQVVQLFQQWEPLHQVSYPANLLLSTMPYNYILFCYNLASAQVGSLQFHLTQPAGSGDKPTSSLFGSAPKPLGTPASTGLNFSLGQPVNKSAAPTLSFGSPATSQSSGGGISFGTPTSSQPATAGLGFGVPAASQPSAGGLSLGTSTSQASVGGGLNFGTPTAFQPSTGGLTFGTPAVSQPSTGGFGTPAAKQLSSGAFGLGSGKYIFSVLYQSI